MKKIYIVDDDRNIVEALSIVLEKEGYEVASQNDEEFLFDNVIAFNPDLIIMDVIFPENSNAGFEMTRQLKKNEQTKKIPILMLSAVNEKGEYGFTFSNRDRDDWFLPVNDFVEKPILPEELLRKVKELTESESLCNI